MLGMFGLAGGWGAIPAASSGYGVRVARRSRERRRSRLLSLGCIRASWSRSDSCGQFRLRVRARVPLRAAGRGGASKLLSFNCGHARARPKSDLKARSEPSNRKSNSPTFFASPKISPFLGKVNKILYAA